MKKTISMLGVPMDLGGGLRGVDMGPSALRIAGIGAAVESLGMNFEDRGNVPVARRERAEAKNPHARFLAKIAECCGELAGSVRSVLEDGNLPLVVGGDHSIACGTVAGLSSFHASRDEKVGLIWFDAHADMNTPETSPSGNVHGMPLASCIGHGPEELVGLGSRLPMVDVKNAVLIGIRELDAGERDLVAETGLKAYSMRELDILGMHRVMEEAIEIATDGTAGFHVSFDLDGCDPFEAPGVGTPVSGGVSLREAHLFMEEVCDSGSMLGLEVTEINPIFDVKNRTAELTVDLVLSALGKRII